MDSKFKKRLAPGIFLTKDNLVFVRYTQANISGKRERTFPASDDRGSDLAKAAQIRNELREDLVAGDKKRYGAGSLTATTTIAHLIEQHITEVGDYGFGSCFKIIKDRFGHMGVSSAEIIMAYSEHMKYLESATSERTKRPYSECTINHFKRVWRMTLQHAVTSERIRKVPVKIRVKKAYQLKRTRIWTEQEREDILEVAKDSPIRWIIEFASVNPIRRGDVLEITKNTWIPERNEVVFYPSKTSERTGKGTHLRNIPEGFAEYVQALPAGHDRLFAWVNPAPSLKAVSVRPITASLLRVEWERVCEKAGVSGLHFHDLNRCAVTYMRRVQGLTPFDINCLGIKGIEIADLYTDFNADNVPRMRTNVLEFRKAVNG